MFLKTRKQSTTSDYYKQLTTRVPLTAALEGSTKGLANYYASKEVEVLKPVWLKQLVSSGYEGDTSSLTPKEIYEELESRGVKPKTSSEALASKYGFHTPGTGKDFSSTMETLNPYKNQPNVTNINYTTNTYQSYNSHEDPTH